MKLISPFQWKHRKQNLFVKGMCEPVMTKVQKNEFVEMAHFYDCVLQYIFWYDQRLYIAKLYFLTTRYFVLKRGF